MVATDDEQRGQVLARLQAVTAAQSEVGRRFARTQRLHTTDAAAMVEILTAEDRGRPLTPARLAERIALTTGATSTLLNRLEAAGHVTRTRENADRRVVTLHVTPASHELAEAFYAPLAEELDAVVAGLSRTQRAAVATFLDRVASVIEGHLAANDVER